jgi:sulfur carrier protein
MQQQSRIIRIKRTLLLELSHSLAHRIRFKRLLKMIQLIVNGQPQRFPVSPAEAGTQDMDAVTLNVTQLLEHMGLQGKRIAIERNGEIIPRSKFDQPILAEGDQLEIVVAVGGG